MPTATSAPMLLPSAAPTVLPSPKPTQLFRMSCGSVALAVESSSCVSWASRWAWSTNLVPTEGDYAEVKSPSNSHDACVGISTTEAVVSRVAVKANVEGRTARLRVQASGRLTIKGQVVVTSELCNYPTVPPTGSTMSPTAPTPQAPTPTPSALPLALPTLFPLTTLPSASPTAMRPYTHLCTGVAWSDSTGSCLPWHRAAMEQ